MKGASQIAPVGIRLPDELKEKVQKRAAENGRSMNAEIVSIIEDSFSTSEGLIAAIEQYRIMEKHFNELISLKDEIIDSQRGSIEHLTEHVNILRSHLEMVQNLLGDKKK